MLKTIKLYGILAKKFGKQFKLDVANTREAIRALSAQIPGFEKFMLHAHEQGLAFAIFQDHCNIIKSELDMRSDAAVIKIIPRVIGAGGDSGVLNIILGVVLVAVGFFAFGTTSALGAGLIGAGIGMAIGGVAQMLMPSPDSIDDQNQDGNKANFGFGGAVTTVAQGNPLPVLRGLREIGGFINSAGQYPEDML